VADRWRFGGGSVAAQPLEEWRDGGAPEPVSRVQRQRAEVLGVPAVPPAIAGCLRTMRRSAWQRREVDAPSAAGT